MKKLKGKLPVTERALLRRINRRLKKDGKLVRVVPGSVRNLGYRVYVLAEGGGVHVIHRSGPSSARKALAALGRELDVLADYEQVVDQ